MTFFVINYFNEFVFQKSLERLLIESDNNFGKNKQDDILEYDNLVGFLSMVRAITINKELSKVYFFSQMS